MLWSIDFGLTCICYSSGNYSSMPNKRNHRCWLPFNKLLVDLFTKQNVFHVLYILLLPGHGDPCSDLSILSNVWSSQGGSSSRWACFKKGYNWKRPIIYLSGNTILIRPSPEKTMTGKNLQDRHNPQALIAKAEVLFSTCNFEHALKFFTRYFKDYKLLIFLLFEMYPE